MMPRKKRLTLIIIPIVILLILIIIALIYLYITTDLFKSNEILFSKYMGKAAKNIETILSDQKGEEYNRLLENNKYKSNAEVTVKYLQKIGTTEENSTNIINNLKINAEGQTDRLNNMDYKKLSLAKNEESIINLEYLKADNKYGIKFADLFKQYLAVENSNLQEFAPKLGITTNVPNMIEEGTLENILSFSNEELEQINNTYVNAIVKDFSKEKFTKVKNTSITIRNQTTDTDSYILKVTKEQINNIYISILEQLKQDEMILSRIDKIDNSLIPSIIDVTQNNKQQEKIKLRDKFIKEIDKKIIEIQNKNIGDDESKITVYENRGETVRITIETQQYKINIDTIVNKTETYIQIFEEIFGNTENSTEFTINKKQDQMNIKYIRTIDKVINTGMLEQTRKIEDNKRELNNVFTYDNGIDKIEVKMKNNTEIVNTFNETPEFKNDNIIVLNKLNDEQLKNILSSANDKMIEKQQSLATQINYEDILNILKRFGAISDTVTISNLNTLTKTEVTKFNAEFEIYKGEQLGVDNVDNLLKVVEKNLDTLEVLSEKVLKLNIKQNTENIELANKVSTLIKNEKNKEKSYSIKMEYDKETGIIKDIIIEIVKKN